MNIHHQICNEQFEQVPTNWEVSRKNNREAYLKISGHHKNQYSQYF